MTAPDAAPLGAHRDPALFREAVSYTAAETGFIPRLIEKDYFYAVLLQRLAAAGSTLIFRGGTCLAKVHIGFYRLSEDLDFVIPTATTATRAERSRRAEQAKRAVAALDEEVPGLRVVEALTGANASTQYNAAIAYRSLLGPQEETIKIEVGLREPLLTDAESAGARTLLLDPVSSTPLVPVVPLPCLSRQEAMAEKLRAALSHREVAIRDFYDVDHAVRRLRFTVLEAGFVTLVRKKLRMPGNGPTDVSAARLAALRPQLEAQLKPVLRAADFALFDLDRAFTTVAEVAEALGAETRGRRR
jgi:predicted nucleotidyltransferase component of viral defense system